MSEMPAKPTPWLTIVTPSLQQGPFLERALRSVRDQGDPGVRHWVIDGGSTDGSVALLERHRETNAATFDFVSEPDEGQAHAVNKGLDRVTTPVVGWLNADDVFLPGTFETVAATLMGPSPPAWMFGRARYIDADDRPLHDYPVRPDFDWEALASVCFFCQPAVFWRPGAFREPPRLDPLLHTALDYDLWIRLGREATPRFVDQALAASRLHPDIKTLRDRRLVYREIVRVVRRHYGHVPVSWAMGRAHGICQPVDDPLRPGRVARRTVTLAAALSLWHNRASLGYMPRAGRELVRFLRAGRTVS